MIRYMPWGGWRMLLRMSGQLQAASSSAPTAVGLNVVPCSDKNVDESPSVRDPPVNLVPNSDMTSTDVTSQSKLGVIQRKKNSIVATAFESLSLEKTQGVKHKRPKTLDERIAAAESVEELLLVSETQGVTRRHALRVVSVLADWAASKRVRLVDFEGDVRFIRLCRMLGRGLPARTPEGDGTGFGDLAMVLGVTGDDEAAKLVGSISLVQMIRVMSSLAQKRRRSTPLLRSLAFNISRNEEMLDLKQAADVLYAMAVLNFPDDLLLERACTDLVAGLSDNKRPAVIGSVLTSLGVMRYKDTELLDALSEWVLANLEQCRTQDVVALLLTLARVNHTPPNADNLFAAVLPTLGSADVQSHTAWLDVVWALTVLDWVNTTHLASVLAPEAVAKLAVTNENNSSSIPVASRLKLLNINAAAQLTVPDYKGSLLPVDSDATKVPLMRSREKQQLVASVLDSLSNLLSSATYLRTNIDTGMGFVIDGECLLDAKCNPLPINQSPTGGRTGTRVAILVLDYHDMCRGSPEPMGTVTLAMRLLVRKGYKIVTIPHMEFNPREKLVTRVRYLEQQLKAVARSP